MATEPEASAYPLSAPKGVPITFDIGDPQGLWITAVAVAAGAIKTLPDGWDIVVLLATVDTIVSFGAAAAPVVAADTEQVDTQFCPADVPVAIQLPDLNFATISADGASTGLLYLQRYRKWQAATPQVQQSNL